MILGELSHAMGYTYSESTVRRALALENLFRFVARPQPFIDESGMQDQLCQHRHSFVYLSLAEYRLDRQRLQLPRWQCKLMGYTLSWSWSIP